MLKHGEVQSKNTQTAPSPPIETQTNTTMVLDGLFRYQLFCLYAFLFIGLWLVLRSEVNGNAVINYAPLWLVAAIGVFAAYSIVQGVANLKDCPDAAKEVERDVQEARVAMKKKGVI